MVARPRRALAAAAVMMLIGGACSDDADDQPVDDNAPQDVADDDGGATQSAAQTPDMPGVEGPITGPGEVAIDALEGLISARANDPDAEAIGTAAEDAGYVFEEYLVSGTAADQPYEVRLLIARPGDEAAEPFSGDVLVEARHPAGFPMLWQFTREYVMSQGHAAVEISLFPSTLGQYRDVNPQRYEGLQLVDELAGDAPPQATNIPAQAADIYAQVGLLLKSDQGSPLPGTERLHLTGHSMSAGPVWHYMDTRHDAYRLPDGDPIYDGFFPETTRTASRFGPFPEVDVPTMLVNSELEVQQVIVDDGIDYRKPDSDEPGTQYRGYEVAGMMHNPMGIRFGLEGVGADRCQTPINDFPYNPVISTALDHLIRWVEDGTAPPGAEPIALTGEPGDDDIAIERDEFGNAVGGLRTTTMDVPVATHTALNRAVDPDLDMPGGSCEVFGGQIDFTADELEDLYGDHASYVEQVDGRLDELIADGWMLEQFAGDLRADAEQFDGFER